MSSAGAAPLTYLLSHTPLDVSIQKHLRNVYNTLFLAVLLATAGALLDLYLNFPLGRIASYLVLPTLIYFTNFSTKYSKFRAFSFYLFAFLDGLAAGPLLEYAVVTDPAIPVIAFVAAAVVFAGFSVSAIFARRGSYLALGAFLWAGILGLFLIQIVNLFTSKLVGFGPMLYGGLMLLCGFILYDTQVIIEKANRGDKDCHGHAMDLLIDFVGIVKRLILILIRNNERREEKKRRGN